VWSARSAHAPQAADKAPLAPGVPPAGDRARDADLARFRAELERFRGGAEELAPSLAQLGERLASAGRPDVRDVCAYYTRLSRDERQRGLAAENEHARLWEKVQEAHASGVREDEWKEERALIESELDVLITRALAEADGVPAARALSLRALLAIERVERDDRLRVDEQEQLARAAREDAREAERRFASAGFLTPQLEPLWIQARVATVLDDPNGADELFAHCRDIAQRVSNTEYARRALESMLRLSQRTADTVSSARLLRELSDCADIASEWRLAHVYSDVLVADDESERAVRFLERHPPAAAADPFDWKLRLANALARAGRTTEARALLAGEAATAAPGARQRDAVRARNVTLTLAVLDLRDGALKRGRERAEAVLRELAPTDGNTRIQALTVLGTALLREGNAARARVELADALAAADEAEARSRRSTGSDAQSNEFGELLGLETVALYADACVRMERDLEAAAAIERTQVQDLRRARAAGSTGESQAVAKLDEASIAHWARGYDAGLLTWVVGADTTVVVHVGADGSASGARIPRGRRGIEDAARRLREAALADDARSAELAAEIERELVPRKIAERLAREPRGTLLCLVHGPLEQLPIELWPLFTSGGLVPACLPGLTSVERDETPLFVAGAGWQLAGAPRDAHGAELLPGARAELDALAALRPNSTLALGDACDRAALVRALASGAPLHLATHVVFSECPGSSRFASAGLELAHGERLCARELAALRPKLPLAFLAACETGGGRFVDALGLQGIARAFLEGGTRNLLVTSWPIADDAARAFALAYHRALLAGRRPSEAAADARAELRASGTPAADWAAFRALGQD
jgi:hypothetical protein